MNKRIIDFAHLLTILAVGLVICVFKMRGDS